MEKLDLFKHFKAEYYARQKPAVIETKPTEYLAIEGSGQPGSDEFQAKIGALYAAAYTLKFQSKFAGRDYTVCKLECLYWADGSEGCELSEMPPDQWRWKMLIRVPDFIGDGELEAAVATIRKKGPVPELDKLGLETISEGTCVQALHVGPYEEESRTIEKMLAHAASEGLTPRGKHHEIYLSDPRRVEPARLRTILRQPVA